MSYSSFHDFDTLLTRIYSLPVRPADEAYASLPSEYSKLAIEMFTKVDGKWHTPAGHRLIATLCMRVGLSLESAAVTQWNLHAEISQTARTRQRSRRRVLSTDAFQMFDAYAAAVWTSVHAVYLDGDTTSPGVQPLPSIYLVASQAIEPNISNLLDDRCFLQPMQCKSLHPMHQLLQRCVNPAARGWATSLLSFCKQSEGMIDVTTTALAICLTGLHPSLEPQVRANWKQRMLISRRVKAAFFGQRACDAIEQVPDAIKEAMRRQLGGLLVDSIAARNVALRLGSPCARLVSPPLDTPPHGMLNTMSLLAQAGQLIATTSMPVTEAINKFYPSVRGEEIITNSPVAWIGRSKQKSHKQHLVDRATDCFMQSFKTTFLPFWMRATSCGARPQRLDGIQHEAIHTTNATLQLCLSLSHEDSLRVQECVLENQDASLICTERAASLLNIDSPGGTARDFEDSFDKMEPHTAAMLLEFARIAWISERVLIVKLSERTRSLQIAALAARHLQVDVEDFPEQEVMNLPEHITHLCVCIECSRVANCIPRSSKNECSEFHETGVSAVTVSHVPNQPPRLYCAKRSSAAFRSAIGAESLAKKRRVDMDTLMRGQPTDSIRCAIISMAHDGSVASRMRRDCKRAFEQRPKAILCGDDEMLTIPLIGFAVRVVGGWYTLCSFCGGCFKYQAHTRIEAEPACLRCANTQHKQEADKTATTRRCCRFCRREEQGRHRSFATYHSPHDIADGNLAKPPARRTTVWCPKHNRPWLQDALRTLTSSQVLAHIANRARPCAMVEHETNELNANSEQSRKPKRNGFKLPRRSKRSI